MKKFEEEFDKQVITFDVIGHHKGVCCLVEEVKAFSKNWISPEDYGKLRDDFDCADERVKLLESTVNELKSQLEKQQSKIPEYVAKDIEDFRNTYIETIGLLYYEDYMSSETLDWIIDIRNQAAFMQALSTGEYTVAKEKRFYLKNKLTGMYLYKVDNIAFGEASDRYGIEDFGGEFHFMQQEIDSMETGSYEQIEVEE